MPTPMPMSIPAPRSTRSNLTFALGRARSLSRSLSVGAMMAILIAVFPGMASATLLTLTFDDGAFDDSIVYPGGDEHGPYDWVETNGIRAAGFWGADVGTPGGYFKQGHTHIQPNYSGRPDGRFEKMHAWTNDLQGLYITLESGLSFDLVSIDWSIKSRESTDPQMQRLPWSSGPEDARLLLSASFDPTDDFETQWTQFAVDVDPGPYPLDWYTKRITGFDNLNGFYLSNTIASMGIDSIVLDVHGGSPVPEPTSALLLGLGLFGLTALRSRDAVRL